ncbi:hypothetical protein [Pontibacter beigongshangensis]|uniref:hypothetical protein n=1 Tax=Pontibacter beigongshangensis TaxID=2574733 RepID=UPI0016502294|nr:hypothetical protein [Pontibacter beigongshangensis]
MKTRLLQNSLFLLFSAACVGCQPSGKEDKSLAATHPRLEQQLHTDSVSTPISTNQNPELYQRYRLNMEDTTTVTDYSAPELYTGELAPVDLSSHAEAQQFGPALTQALKGGINFAGKYTVVTISCGTDCQQHFVVDRENGQVIEKLQSSTGASFSPESRLLIVNPPDSTLNYKQCPYCTPATYVLENNKLVKLNLPN